MSAAGPTWTPALLAAPAGSGVVCRLCPFRCVLPDGRTGVCGVRRNHGGQLQTATRSVAVAHVDAVERKPFFHVLPGSPVLTVAGPGCTFRCTYCINHRLSQYGRDDASGWRGEPADPVAIVARARSAGAVIGMSYTEPSLALELALELVEAAGPEGIRLLWKSNGFLTPEAADLVAPILTAVNIDVKADDEQAHRRLTGASLGPVLDTVERLHAAGVWIEVTTPLIPGTSDSADQLAGIARRIARIDRDIPWHLARFSPDYRLTGQPPTSPEALARAVDVGRDAGLRYVYVERALGAPGRHTSCLTCGHVLIERDVWALAGMTLTDGACPECGAGVPGIWR
ncbi:AmmeMemoRadiSam system radical SAM enzyme [Actinoplanes derwentensis]|uniref:Pyruvate formate lyase activating enzyme n=1 Tax=Actinoplanes derwentensis TaxID=113562 RepID=A0A1H2AI36_9ACTN|nr:AmmeMemoRadiSam system radical SAM enzyme [Actinoplanes derwentensis]GID90308.1 AmmeMemoRadiSam system radical SAM enzyme [Actinoplanes derwentensis]SDT45633.1 pyruvate formate lyase activating enzyme [Actinoplanes derwentensis]